MTTAGRYPPCGPAAGGANRPRPARFLWSLPSRDESRQHESPKARNNVEWQRVLRAFDLSCCRVGCAKGCPSLAGWVTIRHRAVRCRSTASFRRGPRPAPRWAGRAWLLRPGWRRRRSPRRFRATGKRPQRCPVRSRDRPVKSSQNAGQGRSGAGYWWDGHRCPARTVRRAKAQAPLAAIQHAGAAGGGHGFRHHVGHPRLACGTATTSGGSYRGDGRIRSILGQQRFSNAVFSERLGLPCSSRSTSKRTSGGRDCASPRVACIGNALFQC
jgi:hypothetical protein